VLDTDRVPSVRAARPEDALEVAGVHVRAWQMGYRGLLPQGYLDGLRPEERARRYTFAETIAGRPRTFVALERGVICGFVTTGPSRDGPGRGAGEVMALYVDPDHWRSGMGRLLIADARRRLVREGASEAILWLLVGNERGRAFYHADGWAPDGYRRTERIWDVSAEEVRYRRALP